jgi:hypothetical protein
MIALITAKKGKEINNNLIIDNSNTLLINYDKFSEMKKLNQNTNC